MVRKVLCCLICILFSISSFPQKIKTVDGEYTYVVPETVDLEKAKSIALERIKIQLIADEFGTTVSQSNSTFVKNENGKSNIDFMSIGGSEVKGEWIETIGNPIFKTEVHGEQLIVKVWIKGKIREVVSSHIDFASHILRNGTDDKFEDDTFYSGDDLFLSFKSPLAGYMTVYLIDNDGNAFCLLPYQNQEEGNVYVKANERYVFFSAKCAFPDLRQYVDEYTMTCTHTQEVNQIYIIFSPNSFVKALDSKKQENLPRELTNNEFQRWLSQKRVKDPALVFKAKNLTILKK